eukprot:3829157-Prymnesium_polylepis.1
MRGPEHTRVSQRAHALQADGVRQHTVVHAQARARARAGESKGKIECTCRQEGSRAILPRRRALTVYRDARTRVGRLDLVLRLQLVADDADIAIARQKASLVEDPHGRRDAQGGAAVRQL